MLLIFYGNGDRDMAEGLEIERKFLVALPDLGELDVKRSLHIIQTYLLNGNGGSQRRVRRIEENGEVSFTFTEKVFLTDVVRRENEREISQEEYENLLLQAKPGFTPIDKMRTGFCFRGQYFELDVYPFSQEFGIMELEMKSPDQEIIFPDNVQVIREVTGVEGYSNAALANAGHFPGEVV